MAVLLRPALQAAGVIEVAPPLFDTAKVHHSLGLCFTSQARLGLVAGAQRLVVAEAHRAGEQVEQFDMTGALGRFVELARQRFRQGRDIRGVIGQALPGHSAILVACLDLAQEVIGGRRIPMRHWESVSDRQRCGEPRGRFSALHTEAATPG